MTDQTRDEVSRYEQLSPAARTLLENHDELDLAEMLAAERDAHAADHDRQQPARPRRQGAREV